MTAILKMKILAVLEMLLGAFTSVWAWRLIDIKSFWETLDVPLLRPAPNALFETVMLCAGFLIIACSLFLWKADFKYVRLQIVSGLFIIIISAFLYLRATGLIDTELPTVYLAYIPAAFGVVVFMTSFLQLLAKAKKSK